MIDVNNMLYSSLVGDIRQKHFDDFFNAYYATFASILAANNQPMEFTPPMLKKEFYSKNIYGLMLAAAALPLMIMNSEDIPDFGVLTGEGSGPKFDEHKKKVLKFVQSNPMMRSRLLTILDEMKQNGLFNSVVS